MSQWEKTDRPQSHISREEFNKHKKQTHLRLSEVKMPANVINENASKCHQYALNSHQETPGHGGLKAAATSVLQICCPSQWHSGQAGTLGELEVELQDTGQHCPHTSPEQSPKSSVSTTVVSFATSYKGFLVVVSNSGVADYCMLNLVLVFF